MKLILLLLGSLAAIGFSAGARSDDTAVWTCSANSQHVVQAYRNTHTIIVRANTPAKPATCNRAAEPGDFVIRSSGDPDSPITRLIALQDNWMVLDIDEAGRRTLSIMDLRTRRMVMSGQRYATIQCDPTVCGPRESYDDYRAIEFGVGRHGLVFWRPTNEQVTAKNCPDLPAFLGMQGFKPAIQERYLFEFATLKLVDLKEKRCERLSN